MNNHQVADGEAQIYCVPHKECSRHPNYYLIRNSSTMIKKKNIRPANKRAYIYVTWKGCIRQMVLDHFSFQNIVNHETVFCIVWLLVGAELRGCTVNVSIMDHIMKFQFCQPCSA